MLDVIILGLIQGLSEFLPISSSGHVTIALIILGVQENAGFAAAIHIATCLAAIIYFRKDIWDICKGFIQYKNTDLKEERELGINIIIATIPAAILGLIVSKLGLDQYFYSALSIGVSAIIFAILLYFTDKYSQNNQNLNKFGAVIIGATQIIAAVFPGASRSGVTLTASFLLNIKRDYAAKFVFLISIPMTALASLNEIILETSVQFNTNFIIAFVVALISGMMAIHILLYFIGSKSLKWLMLYRIIFGIIAILIAVR